MLRRPARSPVGRRGEQAALKVLARELGTGIERSIPSSTDGTFKKAQLLVLLPYNVMVLSAVAYLKRLLSAPSVDTRLKQFITLGFAQDDRSGAAAA